MSYNRFGSAWAAGSWGAAWGLVQSGELTATGLVIATSVESPGLSSAAVLLSNGVVVPISLDRPGFSQRHLLSAIDVGGSIIVNQPSIESLATLFANHASLQAVIETAQFAQKYNFSIAGLSAQSAADIVQFAQNHGLLTAPVEVLSQIGAPQILLNTTQELLELAAVIERSAALFAPMDTVIQEMVDLQTGSSMAADIYQETGGSTSLATALSIIAKLQETKI